MELDSVIKHAAIEKEKLMDKMESFNNNTIQIQNELERVTALNDQLQKKNEMLTKSFNESLEYPLFKIEKSVKII